MAQTDPTIAAADEFLDSLMETSLYSMGAYFSDEHPELVDEVIVQSEAIEERGLRRYAADNEMSVEEAGRIRVVGSGRTLRAPFLDIRRIVSSGGERGLLSMAFAPDYATSHRVYVYYTARNGDVKIDELQASGDRADASTRRNVIT